VSGKSWKPDPALTRESHRWRFRSAKPQEWGATVTFYCENSGCSTVYSVPVRPDQDAIPAGICFDTSRAVLLTDREGRPM
jgi:hypothetical protein